MENSLTIAYRDAVAVQEAEAEIRRKVWRERGRTAAKAGNFLYNKVAIPALKLVGKGISKTYDGVCNVADAVNDAKDYEALDPSAKYVPKEKSEEETTGWLSRAWDWSAGNSYRFVRDNAGRAMRVRENAHNKRDLEAMAKTVRANVPGSNADYRSMYAAIQGAQAQEKLRSTLGKDVARYEKLLAKAKTPEDFAKVNTLRARINSKRARLLGRTLKDFERVGRDTFYSPHPETYTMGAGI